MLERFLQAGRNGDMDGLVTLLSKDVVLHSDSGGKALAVPNLIHGADRVARGIVLGLRNLVPTAWPGFCGSTEKLASSAIWTGNRIPF